MRSRSDSSSSAGQKSRASLQADFSMCPDEADSATVVSRMSCLKTDLEDRLTAMIDERMKNCDAKIADIQTSVESFQHEVSVATEQTKLELDVIRDQQSSLQTQLGTFESTFQASFNASNTALMNQMQGLFQQMQSSISNRLDSLEPLTETEQKRRKGEL